MVLYGSRHAKVASEAASSASALTPLGTLGDPCPGLATASGAAQECGIASLVEKLLFTDEFSAPWVTDMLYNPSARIAVWSEFDAVREAESQNPPRSPHPRRSRGFGRLARA